MGEAHAEATSVKEPVQGREEEASAPQEEGGYSSEDSSSDESSEESSSESDTQSEREGEPEEEEKELPKRTPLYTEGESRRGLVKGCLDALREVVEREDYPEENVEGLHKLLEEFFQNISTMSFNGKHSKHFTWNDTPFVGSVW